MCRHGGTSRKEGRGKTTGGGVMRLPKIEALMVSRKKKVVGSQGTTNTSFGIVAVC